MSIQSRQSLQIGLFGFGVVGEGLYRALQQTPSLQAQIRRVCIRHAYKKRNAPAELFTTQASQLLEDDRINVIVELTDDAEAAYQIVREALSRGKAVVSANKKMIAAQLPELLELQRISGAPFLYEAACCASLPVIRNLEEYYDHDLLRNICGIVNGSTNYILTKIFEENLPYAEALEAAQLEGFAESDPSLDVSGRDAANKLSILLAHAYGLLCPPERLITGGIEHLHAQDAVFAREKGYQIKLVAEARKLEDGSIAALVLPRFVPHNHQLAGVRNEYNGLLIESSLADTQFFYGKGAGSLPTASAVLSDLSALRYDYRYEYKKLAGSAPRLSHDYYLRVYASFGGLFEVPHERFAHIDSWTSGPDRCTVSGLIHASRLLDTAWWQKPGCSLILYPDAVVTHAEPVAQKPELAYALI